MAAFPGGVTPRNYAISPDEGVHSAHQLPQEKFINLVEIDATVADLDDLFGQPGTAIPACPPKWEESLRAALVGQSSEDLMNGLIQQLFNESFPDHRLLEVDTRVREQYLSTILGLDQGNGLPIRVTSRPDFGLRDEHRCIFGEGKNNEKYSIDHAIRQNGADLLANLYSQVVDRSGLPPAVYGIAVAGSQCKDMNSGEFTVVFQRLSLPQKVGGRLQLRQLLLTQNIPGVLATVWEFLVRVFEVEGDANRTVGGRSPALLQVPYDVLRDGWPNDDVEMVQNGTACLVLKVGSYAGLVDLIALLDDTASSSGSASWQEKDLDFPLFFKSKNYLASDRPTSLDYYAFRGESLDIDEAYRVKYRSIKNGIYILVANLGTTVLEQNCEARSLTMPRLVAKYLAFMERIIRFERESSLYHGDIHVGNVTYFPARGSFMLIDYDEARFRSLVRRDPRIPEQERLYPNGLLGFEDLYTKHQLMMALEDILEAYYPNHEYRRVASFFGDYQRPDNLTPEGVGTRYEMLVEVLNDIGQTDVVADFVDGVKATVVAAFSPLKTRAQRLASGTCL